MSAASLLHVAILIPACNEEELLPRCLASVLRACALLPATVTYDVVVAVDASKDRTLQIAEQMLAGHGTVIQINAGCVGEARMRAADTALHGYDGPVDGCWMANTDADCVVPERWLTDQLTLAEMGIEAIAGIIDVDSFSEHAPYVKERFYDTYVTDADGTHPHVHGANLGVRADAYRKAGGWGKQATAEDHDLWKRLQKAGARSAPVSALVVMTSGRRAGRAEGGFAEALAAHNLPTAQPFTTQDAEFDPTELMQ
jgi:cellulose synthase/poly-beta-1,6-N-acetylglucosamine synthase-like glycosyltransferase